MKYDQIKYAVAVWRQKSFSKAAKKLNISQSAISQQTIKLEEYLGFQLFDRLHTPLTPTVNGLLFFQEAEKILLKFNQLNDFGQSLEAKKKGDLILGVIPTISSFLISLFINDFSQKHPDIKLSVVEMKTEAIIEGLQDRTIHAGIIVTPIKTKLKFTKYPLFYEKFFVYCNEDHKFHSQVDIDIKNSSYDDLWLLREGNCFSNQVLNVCKLDDFYKNNLQYSCDSIDALCRIVDECGGFTFIPEMATINLSEDKEGRVRDIHGKESVREVSMIHLKNEPNTKLVKLVNSSIKSNLPRRMLNKEGKNIIATNIEI